MNGSLSNPAPDTLAAPPRLAASQTRLNWWLLPGAAALIASAAVLFFFNPTEHGFYPVCMFHRMTGLDCPGCGGLRAAHELLHGHVAAAFRLNALFVCGLPIVAAWWLRLAARRLRNVPATFRVPPAALWAFLVAAMVFTVVRNLPGFTWLAP